MCLFKLYYKMKYWIILLVVSVSFTACKNEVSKEEATVEAQEVTQKYRSFGDEISATQVLTPEELVARQSSLKVGDTIPVKFSSKVNTVCQKKGCWMKVNVGEEETMVRFKDYGFFMPLDIAGQEAIIEGVAFLEELSVEDQKHYAEDDGKSAEEIAAITAPKQSLAIISNGVLLPEEVKQ